ncbi:helix-turn-helix transcriptional regulator [Halobacteriales archaeon Cl-PHB]
MTTDSDAVPADALEDVAYLSRSANRVAILDALTGGPSTRRTLAETTGASRTTLDRIVNELETRGWAERTTDGEYVATPAGNLLMAQFRPFLRSVEALRGLGEAVAWLPTEELGVGLEHFADATVREPVQDDPVETVEFMTDLLRNATEFRTLTHLVPPQQLATALADAVESSDQSTEGVMTGEAIDFLRNQPARRERWHDILAAGGELFRCEGPVPCNVWIADDTVLVKASRSDSLQASYGVPIVSRNAEVRSWAHDLIDRYRTEATPVDASAFSESTVSTENY